MARCLALEVVCAECSDQQEEWEAEGARGSHRWAMERMGGDDEEEREEGRREETRAREREWYRGRR